jgi:hypothetical protein
MAGRTPASSAPNDPTTTTSTSTGPQVDPAQPVDSPRLSDEAENKPLHPAGFHDSISGRPVDQHGNYVDGQGDGQVEAHRIVANDWPEWSQAKPEDANPRQATPEREDTDVTGN